MFQRTLIGLATAFVTLVAPTAHAACFAGTCGLMGNARFEFAHIPIPITGLAAPTGAIVATTMATVMQGGIAPRSLVFGGGELKVPPIAITFPVFLLNPNLFEIGVSAGASHPNGPAFFSASGRTGPSTASWCPGFAPPGAVNPGCGNASLGVPVPGRLRYQKTTNQFGGPARAALAGTGHRALRGANPAPCAYGGGADPLCIVVSLKSPVPTSPAIGAPFGVSFASAGLSNPGGTFQGTVTAGGLVVGVGPALGTPAAIARTSYGGPWTTGMMTISVTASGPNSIVMLTGTDKRTAGGSGVISLVSGAVVARGSLGNALNAGWMTLMVPEPRPILGASTALLALIACHTLVVRRATRRSRGR